MYLNSKNNLNSLTLGMVCSLLVACGGGDTTTSTISGTAADGYLKGALACLDTNNNGFCDTGEPSATTTAGGVYNIVVPAGTDTNKPLVVNVPSTAIDEDTGQPVGTAYVMKAPAGKHSFVSPITTMVQMELETNPSLTVNDAEDLVKASINMADDDASLFNDYVAIQKNTPEKANYTQLHKIARDIAQRIAENLAIANNAATAKGVDTKIHAKELYALTMEAIKAKLSDISASAESDPSTTAKGYDIDKAKSDITTTVDVTDIEQKIFDKKSELSKTHVSWEELIQQTPTLLSTGNTPSNYDLYYDKLQFSTTALTFKYYTYVSSATTSAWAERTHNDSNLLLNPDTQKWVAKSSPDSFVLTSQNNGRFVVKEKTSGFEYVFSAAKQNITDQKISRAWPNALQYLTSKGKADITFPKDSDKYTFNINNTNAQLTVGIYGGFGSQNQCYTQHYHPQYTQKQLNGNCNAVYTETAAVKTLDALFEDATTAITSLEHIKIKDFYSHLGVGKRVYYTLIEGSGDTGQIDYYLEKTTTDKLGKSIKLLEKIDISSKNKGQWKRQTYGDKDIILLSHPNHFNGVRREGIDGFNESDFFVVLDGFVRKGLYLPPVGANIKINYLNATAAKSILAEVGIPNPPE